MFSFGEFSEFGLEARWYTQQQAGYRFTHPLRILPEKEFVPLDMQTVIMISFGYRNSISLTAR